LALTTLIVWGIAWAQMGATRQSASLPTYIDSGRWEAAAWLRRLNTLELVSISNSEADRLVATLSGHPTTNAPASLELLNGLPCGKPGTQFLAGDVCVFKH
jgi:hypothetical protein